MHREKLLKSIKTYSLSKWCDLTERETISQFIEFISKQPNCFKRSLKIGHLTASCWLWNSEQSACLFTLHRKLNKWLQLGGHADGQTNLLQVAIQEAKEESGLIHIEPVTVDIFDLSIHQIPAHKDIEAHLHYDVRFILKAVDDSPLQICEESIDLKWIDLNDFSNYELDESILKMKSKLVKEANQLNF